MRKSEAPTHFDIVCDSCGMDPIVGGRWSNKKKPNYDLFKTLTEVNGKRGEEIIPSFLS